jgi:geranylgeranyl pyrophosphate synthase
MATTINSANYVYFESLKDVMELNSTTATKVFMDELLNLHLGQGMDIYWRDQNVCPTEEEYIHMVKQSKPTNFFNTLKRNWRIIPFGNWTHGVIK